MTRKKRLIFSKKYFIKYSINLKYENDWMPFLLQQNKKKNIKQEERITLNKFENDDEEYDDQKQTKRNETNESHHCKKEQEFSTNHHFHISILYFLHNKVLVC